MNYVSWLQTGAASVAAARDVQPEWASVPLRKRLEAVRSVRYGLAESARELLELFPRSLDRSRTDTLTSEILPLVAACRFLENQAPAILKPRRLRSGLFSRVEIELVPEPVGVVLLIGPANYPLFLPGVQALQALAAGNCVLWKPGTGGEAIARAFALLVRSAKVPENALQILDESPETGLDVISEGVDKVVLTGSHKAAKAVLAEAAEHVTPVIAELSGNDPVIVHSTADLRRAARSIAFGLRLNAGNTCIAPRRVIAHSSVAHQLEVELSVALEQLPDIPIVQFETEEEAVAIANFGPYALGASVFAHPSVARDLARRIVAGVVVVNDVIVPTADARLPFGGRKQSGFGKTRGREGLLEFTALKAIAVQKARRLRHVEPIPANSDELFLQLLAARNSRTMRARVKGWSALMKTVAQSKEGKN